ncbi:response regulator transcription factor [Frankia sp. AiPs1]|uniref:winged helix-turn-helix domain-containing protein n=1 Tax=Frankia sp. AiPs1 TaxID=573493 RepID=UPI00204391DB|nr:response regulator transcription factor [Frankia sp. AiPs1]MCM3923324.1 response regulator transcription factor [Frankia sp. AiPs1]
MRTTLLLVGNEAALRRNLVPALLGEGYGVDTAATGEQALALLAARGAHLVLTCLPLATEVLWLDELVFGQPGGDPSEADCPDDPGGLDQAMPMDGLEFCRRLRAAGDVPLVVVADRLDPTGVIASLEAGADDYVTAPPVTPEVLARLRALLRRVHPQQATTSALSVGDLQIRPSEGVVIRRGEVQHLTRTEFRLLCELAVAGGRAVTRKQLLERIWGYDYFGGARMLDVHVRRLRRKVEVDPSAPTHILTVRGIGYRVCTASPSPLALAPTASAASAASAGTSAPAGTTASTAPARPSPGTLVTR